MTKQQTVELLQSVLASGDVPSDIQGRYNYDVCSAVIGNLCSSIFATDANFGDQMAYPYELKLQGTEGKFFIDLPVVPMNGSQGIRVVEKDGVFYYGIQGAVEYILYKRLGGVQSPVWDLRNTKLTWYGCTTTWAAGDDVSVSILADFWSMDDDDQFIPEKYSAELMAKAVVFVQQNNIHREEKINDTKQDA
jgi:hypothetical protein